jgi:hypothetical protein
MVYQSNISTLGFVASQKRQIKSGSEFNALFGAPLYTDPVLHGKMDVDKTLELMAQTVRMHKHEVEKIAEHLYNPDVYEFSKNIWNFVYNHIQYAPDKIGVEQLRTPARTWADRHKGVDCDCQSIWISAVLSSKNIPHFFRIAKYGKDNWQHVYVVVPHNGQQIIVDTVMDSFNAEKGYSAKKDFSPITGKPLTIGLGNIFQSNHLATTQTETSMFTWIKANPITTAAIGVLLGTVGFVAFTQIKKAKTSTTATKVAGIAGKKRSGKKQLK